MNICQAFLENAALYPDSIAIIDKDHSSISYKTLAERVCHYQAYLLDKGIRKGDRILVMVPMSIELYVALLAIVKMGAVAVFVEEWASFNRFLHCTKTADCKALLISGRIRYIAWFFQTLRNIPLWISPKPHANKTMKETNTYQKMDEDDPALITFTTGSTGLPKGAIRSHGILHAQMNLLSNYLPSQQKKVLLALPIVLLLNLAKGYTSVVADFPMKPRLKKDGTPLRRQMRLHDIDMVVASPFLWQKLFESMLIEKSQEKELLVFIGWASCFPDDIYTWVKEMPSSTFRMIYGSTEAEPIASYQASRSQVDEPMGIPLGVLAAKTDCRIWPLTKAGNSPLILPEPFQSQLHQSFGELLVSGDQVVQSYIGHSASESKISIEDKLWHRTGDVVYLDNDQLYLLGRLQSTQLTKQYYLPSLAMQSALRRKNKAWRQSLLINFNDEITIVLEESTNLNKSAFEEHVQVTYPWVERIAYLPKMPMDARHHSKIVVEKVVNSL